MKEEECDKVYVYVYVFSGDCFLVEQIPIETVDLCYEKIQKFR